MFHKTAQSLLTSKISSSLSQGSVTAGNKGSVGEETEGIGLNRFTDLEAGILNSTLEWFGRKPSDKRVGLMKKHRY